MLQIDSKISFINQRLTVEEWQSHQRKHHHDAGKIIDPYLQQKNHHHKDPVIDFLFEYYAFRPSHLKRWSPGFGVMLEDADQDNTPDISELSVTEDGAFLNPDYFPDKRKRAARWILELLEKSLHKKPSFGCFGMHEWAMVYKADNIRHNHLPLRMPPKKLAAFVESRPLVCTHFDAYRFFTKPAKPLNRFDLNRDEFEDTEQAGCLHTNMDLYKWSFKMFPWISSQTLWKAFLLARQARIIDMQASPYDLREQGLEPIKIEMAEGRITYIERQKEIYQQSVPIRKQLIDEYRRLIASF